MDVIIDRLHFLHCLNLTEMSELEANDCNRFEIALICIGLGIGEVCKKCLSLFPCHYSHDNMCNEFGQPIMANSFTVTKFGERLKCKLCLKEAKVLQNEKF